MLGRVLLRCQRRAQTLGVLSSALDLASPAASPKQALAELRWNVLLAVPKILFVQSRENHREGRPPEKLPPLALQRCCFTASFGWPGEALR